MLHVCQRASALNHELANGFLFVAWVCRRAAVDYSQIIGDWPSFRHWWLDAPSASSLISILSPMQLGLASPRCVYREWMEWDAETGIECNHGSSASDSLPFCMRSDTMHFIDGLVSHTLMNGIALLLLYFLCAAIQL
jgi:hypothetical protein